MSGKINIFVIEDRPEEALRVESIIHAMGYNVQGVSDNAFDALDRIRKDKPDVLIVDVNLSGAINGIELVERIKDLLIPVIYSTGLEDKEIYERAQNTSPAAYLVKPFNKLTFQTALENAIISLSKDSKSVRAIDDDEDLWMPDCFFIKRNNVLQKVDLKQIEYIRSEGNYCEIFTQSKYVVKMSLTQILKKLPKNQFQRIHQRFVVQLCKIESIDMNHQEVLFSGKEIPIGPKYKEELLKKLNKLT